MDTKKSVLALLEARRGQSTSGAYMAKQLGVTRNAVWKAVMSLRKEGFRISAVTNKGYRLCDDPDILSVQGMLPFLSDGLMAERISIHAVLASTNQRAKALAIEGAAHGTIVMADAQSAGRGRQQRHFHSPPGHGIYISFVLHPALWPGQGESSLITAYAALAVCEAIEATTGKAPGIKWVNDVFLEGKKICGILTEAALDLESGHAQWVVLGIGINFTTPEGGFPADIADIAGSVFSAGRPTVTRNQLAAALINRVMDMDSPRDSQTVLAAYKKRLLVIGKKVLVTGPFAPFEATALDINEAGHLVVEKENGEKLSLFAGEISILLQ